MPSPPLNVALWDKLALMTGLRCAASFFAICAGASFSRAQRPSGTARPEFEVASVKPATSRELNGLHVYPGGRVECNGCILQYLIEEAFDIQGFQLGGGPAWMVADRYDIEAKPPASSMSSHSNPPYSKAHPNEEQRQMLQSLLMDRFQLKYHRETKEGPVYLLVRGKKPLRMEDSKDKGAYPWSGSLRGGAIMGDGLAGTNESMADLAWRLRSYLGRPVLDRTGLSGSYDFRVEYQVDGPQPDVISMIMATLQDLGLKLEVSRGPIETIVIEHAAKPSAN
jgi:uncharacterized protein (TIGR03435 family)